MRVPAQAPAVAPHQRGRLVHRARSGAGSAYGVRPSQHDGDEGGGEGDEEGGEDGGQGDEGDASVESE
jgi:hypothetical protein